MFAYGDFHRTGRYEYILEGYIVDRTVSSVTEMIARGLENCTPLGAYNVVLVDPENDTFEVKTDKRSYVPLYVFQSQGKVAVSNNPWLLADEFRDDITLDESSLRAQLVYATDPVPCRTLLKHITRIGVGAYLRYESKRGVSAPDKTTTSNTYRTTGSLWRSNSLSRTTILPGFSPP